MPPSPAWSTRERGDVTAYRQPRSPGGRPGGRSPPITSPDEPASTRAAVTRGRELFEANCSKCHGDGTGNGPSAVKGMVDDWGMAITPANLTLGRGKWARTAGDIYVRAMAGINGTPMPESADALTPEQVWQVAHYVQALGGWAGATPGPPRVAAPPPPPRAGGPPPARTGEPAKPPVVWAPADSAP